MSRIFVKNLPPTLTEQQLKEHFQQISTITDAIIITNPDKNSRCIGYIGFQDPAAANRAIRLRNNTYLNGRKILVLIAVSHKIAETNNLKDVKKHKNLSSGARNLAEQMVQEGGDMLKQYLNTGTGWCQNVVAPEKIIKSTTIPLSTPTIIDKPNEFGEIDDSKIKLKNVPTITTEEQLMHHFKPFGQISDIIISTNPLTKQPTGVAYIQFSVPESARKAVLAQETQLNGRFVQISQGRTSAISEFIKKKEYSAKGFDKNNKLAWNPLIQRQQNIVQQMGEFLGEKAELINQNAVTMAAAEAFLQKELKEAFQAVNISTTQTDLPRSKTHILCKQLASDITEKSIKDLFEQFGIVISCKLFFTGFCLVQMAESSDAKRAFNKLAFKKLGKQKSPMMLEFAIVLSQEEKIKLDAEAVIEGEKQAVLDEQVTVIIKNISFATEKSQIEQLVEKHVKDAIQLIIPQNEYSHKGYAFLTIPLNSMNQVIQSLSSITQDGYKWEAQKSRASVSQSGFTSTRLMVKNLAFQANSKELRQLLDQFGRVSALRCPKNLDGGLRGFAFVEYATAREAKAAAEGVNGVHFYGRRLVIEVAKEEAVQQEDLQ